MSKRDVSGSEGMEQMRDTGTTRTVFKTAYKVDGLTLKHRLVLDSTNYEIQVIKELGRREGQEITCIVKY